MTDLEQRAIRLLLDVKVPDKNWHGARIESLNMRLTVQPDMPLPLSDRSDLWYLVWRYRRQIDDNDIVRKANELVNGALSLAF